MIQTPIIHFGKTHDAKVLTFPMIGTVEAYEHGNKMLSLTPSALTPRDRYVDNVANIYEKLLLNFVCFAHRIRFSYVRHHQTSG
jgi:hypothetical protein